MLDANAMTDRTAARAALLAQAGWAEARAEPLAGDASSRSYERLWLGERSAVLMDAPPTAEKPSCPPGASVEERQALGYNAAARLAGANASAFAGVSDELHRRGFSAPNIMAADAAQGFLLLEDLGDALYSRAIGEGADPTTLYAAAVDVLAAIRRSTLPEVVGGRDTPWTILSYDRTARQTEADLLVEWYVPHRMGAPLSEAALEAWRAAWAALDPLLDGEGPALTLRDVHADNLLWLPHRDGLARVGLIDFQDALFGHPAYDLVSLLEDARRDVDPVLAEAMITRYIERACITKADDFRRAYKLLGAQRNAKILGIFVRLAHRDNKPHYLKWLPRVARHFVSDLAHPDLEPLKAWTHAHAPAVFEDAAT